MKIVAILASIYLSGILACSQFQFNRTVSIVVRNNQAGALNGVVRPRIRPSRLVDLGSSEGPDYDSNRLSLYSGSGSAITCSTTEKSPTLYCPGGTGDFAIGQGIAIPLAGEASSFPEWGTTAIIKYSRKANVSTLMYSGPTFGAGQTVAISGLPDPSFNGTYTISDNDGVNAHITYANPGPDISIAAGSGKARLVSAQLVVTPEGIMNGTTTYDYKVVLRGYHGELSVASNVGETTHGANKLGVNVVNISTLSRSSGVTTVTTRTGHNFQVGASVDIEGVDGATANTYTGSHVIIATPSSTTFTFLQSSAGDDSGTAMSGTARVVAKNTVRWNMQQYANLQSIVYRSKDRGEYSIVGIVEGMDGAFVDWGLAAPLVPAYVPRTPPSSATNGILASRIVAIKGIEITLDIAAKATSKSQMAQHDNTPVVLAGCSTMSAQGSGTLYIAGDHPSKAPMFNSPLDLYHSCSVKQLILYVGSSIQVNEPIVALRRGMTVKAINPSGDNYRDGTTAYTSQVTGRGYPFFYFVPGSFGPNTLENLYMQANGSYQSAVVEDGDAGGGAVVNTQYSNDHFIGGNGGSMPFISRGGFNKNFYRDSFTALGDWGVPEALLFTVQHSLGASAYVVRGLPYIVEFDRCYFRQHGIEFNDWGLKLPVPAGPFTWLSPIMEDGYVPWLTFNTTDSVVTNLQINNAIYADFLGGSSTPFIQAGKSNLPTITSRFSSCANSAQPLFEGVVNAADVTGGYAQGCNMLGTNTAIITSQVGATAFRSYQGISLQVSGTSQVYYPMTIPSAPAKVSASAGGSIPLGKNCFAITANDANGGETTVGPTTCVRTTQGNQIVQITRPTLPSNATAWNVYWIVGGTGKLACSPIPGGTLTYVHSVPHSCTNTTPLLNTASMSAIGAHGVSGFRVSAATYATTTNCSTNTESPAACEAAAAGAFVVPTGATTYTVNTTAVTSKSRILLQAITFAADLPDSPKCVSPTSGAVTISAIIAGASFSVALPSTHGQTCWYYSIQD